MGLFGSDSYSSSSTTVNRTETVDSYNTTVQRISNINDAGNIKVDKASLGDLFGGDTGMQSILDAIGLGSDSTDPGSFNWKPWVFAAVIAIVIIFWRK